MKLGFSRIEVNEIEPDSSQNQLKTIQSERNLAHGSNAATAVSQRKAAYTTTARNSKTTGAADDTAPAHANRSGTAALVDSVNAPPVPGADSTTTGLHAALLQHRATAERSRPRVTGGMP